MGIKVRCLVRSGRKDLSWLQGLPVDVISGDLRTFASLHDELKDINYVVHVAGITRAKHINDFDTLNAVATGNLLQLVSKLPHLKKFCYISSLTAVGPSLDGLPVQEETPCNPLSAYGRSKLRAEKICSSYMESIPVVIVRPPAVYGPRDKDVLELFKTARMGIETIIGPQPKTFSAVYGTDLADGIVEATLSDKTIGKTYFISDPEIHSFSRVYEFLADLMGKKLIRLRVSSGLVQTAAVFSELISHFSSSPPLLSFDKTYDLLQKNYTCTPEKFRQDVGFTASTPFEKGFTETYEWYLQNKWL